MPSKTVNSSPAFRLLQQKIHALSWTIQGFLNHLEGYGHHLTRDNFYNLGRPNRAGFYPELIKGIIKVFVNDPPPKQRWTARDALKFGLAAGQPLEQLRELAPLFPSADFAPAYHALLIQAGSSSRQELQDLADAAFQSLPPNAIPPPANLPPRSYGNFPPIDPHFLGRETELRRLAYELKTTPTARIVLTGIPGLGKTALAGDLVWRYGQYFLGGVFFLVADTTQRLHAGLIALGGPEALDCGPWFADLPEATQLDQIRTVLQDRDHCLLVIDNADDLDADHLVSLLPAFGACRVVMTSRHRDWGTQWHEHQLGTLSPADSEKLLGGVCLRLDPRDPEQKQLTAQLAEQLGHLPLALRLAGAYLHSHPDRYSDVLAALLNDLRHGEALMHAALVNPGEDVSGIQAGQRLDAVIAYFIGKLDVGHPIEGPARDLLTAAAVFAPGHGIDRELLLATAQVQVPGHGSDRAAGLAENPKIVRDALKVLRDRSMLVPGAQDELMLHRLVRSYVRAHSDLTIAVAQVAEVFQHTLTAKNEALEAMHRFSTHLRSLAEDAVRHEIARAAEICFILGWYLTRNSEHDAALHWVVQARNLALQRYGWEHEIAAEAFCRLGLAHLYRNEHAETDQAYREMIAIQSKVYPPDHPQYIERLIGYKNLGQFLIIDGNYHEGEHYIRLALDGFRQLHANQMDHANGIQGSLRVLGMHALCVGRYRRACRYYALALRFQRQTSQPLPHMTAQIAHDLASVSILLGEYERAGGLFEEALTLRKQLHANRSDAMGCIWHQDVAETLAGIGRLMTVTNDLDRAAYYLDQALTIFTTTLEPQSMEVGETLEALSEVALRSEQYDRARDQLDRAATNYRQVYPTDRHPSLARIALRYGRMALLRDNLDEAESHCAEVQQRCIQLGLPHHPLASWAYACAGEIARRRGQIEKAQALWDRARIGLRRTMPHHPSCVHLLRNNDVVVLNPFECVIG